MRLLKYISVTAMTLLYLTAGLGYGLHICDSEGSVTPLIMIEDASCENVHGHSHHEHCSGDHSSDCHNEGDCCHTEVFQLKDIYEASVSFQIEQPTESLLPVAILNGELLDYVAVSDDLKVEHPEYSPPENVPDKFHALVSVWRL